MKTVERSYKCKEITKQKISCNHLTFKPLQKGLFYVVKQALLHGKTGSFATQNRHF